MNCKIGFFFFVLLFLITGCHDEYKKSSPEFWVWMHADVNKEPTEWASDFRKLKEAGFTGVLLGANPRVLEAAIPEAKKSGLEVYAWMWAMNRSDADPAWLSVNQKGKSLAEEKAYVGYYKFMCPALPEVKDFLKTKIDELAKIKGLDGIHLDYIRYVDAILPIGLQPKYGLKQDSIFPEFDYGYHPRMIDLYKQKTGIDPLGLPNPATDPDWLQFRLDELNKTVLGLRDYIHQKGLSASAAVFPTPAMSREMVRQEWNKWDLDCYFPMVYHNFYNEDTEWIRKVMIENKSIIPPEQKVICGIYAPALQNPGNLDQAILEALEGGADGISFFDYGSLNDSMMMTISNYKQKSIGTANNREN
ncbi:MAG: family 10 glycosylhydrolase [Bacteroidales bacterium]|nr:family 10 glycosylhydrolase [Bacteroidales bacterium]